MKIPKKLASFATALAETVQPSLIINGTVAETDLTDHKFAGNPYWLKELPYPTTDDGRPLRLLAQINFEKITASIPDFPTEGILQFFVENDDVYGLNFDDQTMQSSFRVIYHETIETDRSKLLQDFPMFDDEDYFPISKECALSFEESSELVSTNDYRFNKVTNLHALFDEEKYDEYDELTNEYQELYSGQGSKLGGYPFFTQEDPRAYGEHTDLDVLLLQIDTDDDLEIIWGDSGVANFFISREDLKRKDFSNVLYNWDCF